MAKYAIIVNNKKQLDELKPNAWRNHFTYPHYMVIFDDDSMGQYNLGTIHDHLDRDIRNRKSCKIVCYNRYKEIKYGLCSDSDKAGAD